MIFDDPRPPSPWCEIGKGVLIAGLSYLVTRALEWGIDSFKEYRALKRGSGDDSKTKDGT